MTLLRTAIKSTPPYPVVSKARITITRFGRQAACTAVARLQATLHNPPSQRPPVVIAASPRGGSTWVSEIVEASMHDPAVIWEIGRAHV